MITIENAYINKFKKFGHEYLFYVTNGVFLGFNEDLNYIGMETFYGLSPKKFADLEQKALNTLYTLGWIYDK